MLERLIFTAIIGYMLIVQIFNAKLIRPLIETKGRAWVYDQTVKSAWGLTLLIVALIFLFQVPPSEVGLTFAPETGNEQAWQVFFLSCILVAFTLVFYLLVKTSSKLRRALRPYYELDLEKLLLPRTKNEEQAWSAVSVTAGVTEEFIFRGVLLYTISLYIEVPNLTLALIGGALFGMAHAYQGIKGVVTTGVVGFGLGLLYLGMGVLWPVMVLHALLDLIAGPIHVDVKND
ncbi:CPBP family intramembrane glutamic endopeptidase [Exiguobacterium aestuarii]|uniref:CPBP family intramembrane glutamic endopeptidase n=1 Tax=Exiguobacterium aestuarii TaxID=273527 RepID=A0ABW2PKN8_9BACL|nr:MULTISPECIES: CPBP family intramembrane glutamic endopeptidase [Exiguobacterium]MCT4786701.1 CPBP family intramembrane metalloprotease [Exiguobacterium aestuarii]